MSNVWRTARMTGGPRLTSIYGDQVAEEEEAGRRFGALLRSHRQAAKLRQEDVAERSGVSLSTINRWERGIVRNPVPTELQVVCRIVSLSTVAAGLALGYLAPEDVEHLPEPPGPADPREAVALDILRDPELPDSLRDSAYHYLEFVRSQAHRQQPETDQSSQAAS